MHTGKIKKDGIGFKVIAYVTTGLFSLLCMFPFLLLIISSFMDEQEILMEGFKLIPKRVTVSAYEFLFQNPTTLIQSYGVTILITVVGTFGGLLIMSMAGYVLNRSDFKYRGGFSFFMYYFAMKQ